MDCDEAYFKDKFYKFFYGTFFNIFYFNVRTTNLPGKMESMHENLQKERDAWEILATLPSIWAEHFK